ncbi:MAG: hypothetical protein JST67_05805 [Bacteroidetes bacterium]|nr:hypothetical protein [Bacteroidota bacterium]
MRIVDTIPHPSLQISIFQMNEKYLVKFEAAMMEQVFKFDTMEVKSIENLKKMIDASFIDGVRKRFNDMYLQYKAAL